MKLFNKRSSGQYKRRLKEKAVNKSVGCLGILIIWAFRLFFWPLSLIYYGFIKKDINKNWKLLWKIITLICWTIITVTFISSKYYSENDIKSDNKTIDKMIKNDSIK